MNTENSGRGLLKSLFGFLRELNQLRNPVSCDLNTAENLLRLNDWPKHPFVKVWCGESEQMDMGMQLTQPDTRCSVRGWTTRRT